MRFLPTVVHGEHREGLWTLPHNRSASSEMPWTSQRGPADYMMVTTFYERVFRDSTALILCEW